MKAKVCLLTTVLLLTVFITVNAQSFWPKDVKLSSGVTVTIYEPQPESFSGNKITGRAAVSFRKTAKAEPIFGAIFYTAIITTDKNNRMAELDSLDITNAKFTGVDDQTQIDQMVTAIEKEAPRWDLKISLDALITSIKKDNNSSTNDQFKNDPPKIIYRTKPTTLVVLDGDPKIQKDKDLDADKVVNSPNLIFKEGSQWNMYVGGIWYKSSSVKEGWKQNTSLSAKLKSVNDQIKKQEKENNGGKEVTEKPIVTDIVVATEPTELLQSKGEADYKTIQNTSLLYVSNTSNEIFKDINSQKTYVLLAGRWYAAPNINGPWAYIAADKLPADFAKIPEGSDKDGVLASVAGTDAAEEAKIDAEIPQTAKVDKKSVTVKVEYDGTPKFKAIEGTSLQLAENSNLTVMIDPAGRYFALDNGIWFVSKNATGPWEVANERPKDVEKIPASSPAYNSKYVYIYDNTPDYVYVGYTAGYMGGYVYGPTIVYGTGFYYNPWYGAVYYPRPVTWGFGFSYNPWTGWSMGFSVNYGFMHVGFYGGGYHGGGCWFGPPMYRPPYRPPYHGGGYYGGGNHVNHYGNTNITINNNTNNIYNNHKGVTTKNIDRSKNNISNSKVGNNKVSGNNKINSNNNSSKNNVFADKDGGVFQKDAKTNNWNARDNKTNSWKPATNDANKLSDLNNQQKARDRSNTRENNFNRDVPNKTQSRPAPSGRSSAPAARPASSGASARPAPRGNG